MTLRARMHQLSTQSLVYGLSGALAKLVALIIVPVLLHTFAASDFAKIDLITAFSAFIGAILVLGSDAAGDARCYRPGSSFSSR